MKKQFTCFLAALIVSMSAFFQTASAQYSIPAKQAWWYDARFGMFIHFGSYSYLAHGEWAFATENWTKTNYQTQVSANFNPTNFNATTIATLAKNAGMKYLVITAKHHEGFCMWKTAVASFKDVTGAKMYDLQDFTQFGSRDILQELKTACDAQGIKFCLYYSILDWDHSSQLYNSSTNFTNMSSMTARTNYINDMKAQLSELVTKYHPAILWFDGDWTYNYGSPTLTSWWTYNDGVDLYNYITGLDPNLLVNERVFRGAGLGDWMCPEQTVPAAPESRPWETCQTMNNSWGYNMWDSNWKTTAALIQQLVQVVSRDGNLLLNIGPMGDGTVPSASVTILNGFSDWMNIYSESIYGTTRSPFPAEPSWGYYTKKSGKLYAHVFTWPTNGQLVIPALSNTINKIYLLNNPSTLLSYTNANGFILISVPTTAPNSINSVVVVEVSGVPAPDISAIVSGGTYQIIAKHSGKVIGINAGSTRNNALAVQQTYTGATSQQFILTDVGGGYYSISPSSSSAKALMVQRNSTADGANIIQYTYSGDASQQWQLVPNGLYYNIKSRNSGKCIDVNGASTADGASIIQWTCGTGTNQQFTFSRLKSTQEVIAPIVSKPGLEVYPNPSKDGVLYVNVPADEKEVTISIYNVQGKLVYKKAFGQTGMIRLESGLSKGLYILKVTGAKNYSEKVIIE